MIVKQTRSERMAEKIGTAMIISWFVFLGPIGFLLLLGVAYSMFVQNLAVGVICGVLAFVPVILLIVWFPLVIATRRQHQEGTGIPRSYTWLAESAKARDPCNCIMCALIQRFHEASW